MFSDKPAPGGGGSWRHQKRQGEGAALLSKLRVLSPTPVSPKEPFQAMCRALAYINHDAGIGQGDGTLSTRIFSGTVLLFHPGH